MHKAGIQCELFCNVFIIPHALFLCNSPEKIVAESDGVKAVTENGSHPWKKEAIFCFRSRRIFAYSARIQYKKPAL